MYIQGCNVTLEIFAEKLKQLWSTGIWIGKITYRVELVNGIWDGRGYEQVTKTQGGGSHKGCNACDFSRVLHLLIQFAILSISDFTT